eukprot:7692231-Alexandrium_andersonii.AAC.1
MLLSLCFWLGMHLRLPLGLLFAQLLDARGADGGCERSGLGADILRGGTDHQQQTTNSAQLYDS